MVEPFRFFGHTSLTAAATSITAVFSKSSSSSSSKSEEEDEYSNKNRGQPSELLRQICGCEELGKKTYRPTARRARRRRFWPIGG
jgi:hypothetical protein